MCPFQIANGHILFLCLYIPFTHPCLVSKAAGLFSFMVCCQAWWNENDPFSFLWTGQTSYATANKTFLGVPETGRLKKVNSIERRNVLPKQKLLILAKKLALLNYVNLQSAHHSREDHKRAQHVPQASSGRYLQFRSKQNYCDGIGRRGEHQDVTMSNSEEFYTGMIQLQTRRVRNSFLVPNQWSEKQQSCVSSTKVHWNIYRDSIKE